VPLAVLAPGGQSGNFWIYPVGIHGVMLSQAENGF